jgi:hypothetical protein
LRALFQWLESSKRYGSDLLGAPYHDLSQNTTEIIVRALKFNSPEPEPI